MEHKLSGCTNRALHQTSKAVDYLNLVMPVIPKDDDDPSRQFLYHSTILMLQSYYEEYLRCVIALGTFWKAPELRDHLAQGQEDEERIRLMPAPEIAEMAQDRVAFEKGARRLKALIQVVTGRGPFPNDVTERRCLDFANVRNLIAHRGGLPHSITAPIAHLRSVAIQTTDIKGAQFHKLRVTAAFFADSLVGLQESIRHIEQSMATDPKLSLKLDIDT